MPFFLVAPQTELLPTVSQVNRSSLATSVGADLSASSFGLPNSWYTLSPQQKALPDDVAAQAVEYPPTDKIAKFVRSSLTASGE